MKKQHINIFEHQDGLVEGLSEFFARKVQEKNGLYHVALSGGSTPKQWYQNLTSRHRLHIDWEKVRFYWGDERMVPPDSAESNFGEASRLLLKPLNIPDAHHLRIRGELPASKAAEEYERSLLQVLPMADNVPVLDIVVLGMGDDGHTASIFPGQLHLWSHERLCVAAEHPQSGQPRVSFTGKMINNARHVVMLVSGAGKAEKVAEILAVKPGSEHLPASWVDPGRGQLYWFLDKDAAKLYAS
jgi:6-phosphogluconolactonase